MYLANTNTSGVFLASHFTSLGASPTLTLALPFMLKCILRQKKNYGNSNISPCKNIIFPKNPPKQTKILQDIITL
jgi:hypothetical protein